MYTDDIHTVKITTNTLLERIVVALIQSPMVLIQKVGANSWRLPSFKHIDQSFHEVTEFADMFELQPILQECIAC